MGSLFLKRNVENFLDRFQIKDCNPVNTPVEFHLKLYKDHERRNVDSTLYKKITGNLIYLTTTRQDIKYYVSLINKYMEKCIC